MPNPTVTIIGIHKVPITEELFRHAMELKYGGVQLSAPQRDAAESAVRAELESVVLIECRVLDADGRFDVSDFHQPGSDQAPYDEAYLSADGATMLPSRYTKPSIFDFRVCFYLHFYDPKKSLSTSYGPLTLPPITAMPDRLRDLVEYEPVT